MAWRQRPTRAGQLRYLEYFHHALRKPVPIRPVRISAVCLSTAPAVHGASSRFRPAVRVSADGGEVFRSGEFRLGEGEREDDEEHIGGKGATEDGGEGGGQGGAGCGGCFVWSRLATGRSPAGSQSFGVLSGR